MRLALISDIHGNLVALQTVLKAIDALKPDAIWFLGDVVGYGPEPQACVELVQQAAAVILAGNHDLAVAGRADLDDFTETAQAALRWHQRLLPAETLTWLAGLPSLLVQDGITLAHGSPRSPVWEYVVDDDSASANADHFDTQLCLIGHSHGAIAWQLTKGRWWRQAKLQRRPSGEALSLAEDRWLLNPGSVGQPRDHDPRASFAILDTEAQTWTWHRHDYDIAPVAEAILAAGMPPKLARRLFDGT
ncbi:MAG: metallophosphatase family protein [Caldilineales bacterium]|nr:metallophosphatase family protein [Caldilineales bacterium]